MLMLKQGWSLIGFNDTKTLFICLLIKLSSILEVYLSKVKVSLKRLKIPYPVEEFESPSQLSESSWAKCKHNRIKEKDLNPQKNGYKSLRSKSK